MPVKQPIPIQKAMRCGLGVTDNARKGMTKFAKGEHALFSLQEAFDIYIEKRPNNRQGNMSFSFFFDNETNDALSKKLQGKVAVMECVYQHDGFLATGFHVRGAREIVRTNRRLPVRLKFQLGRNTGATMPVDLYTSLRELPIAEERSDYVKKRIASWEGYLRIQERNADVADVTSAFSQASFNEDFSKLRLVCKDLKGEDWQAIKGFSAKMTGTSQDIGNVIHVTRAKNSVEIELSRHYQEMARHNKWHPKSSKTVTFSNFAELSQVRRLRKGFKDLQDGLAANSNLEKILFEERPTVRLAKKQKELVFHNTLNKFQQEAVTGAMTCHDLYVIQGPPGTGKTTVISEICHQNVKAGLKTLVASQANLAVDNALGRLLSHQDIRILRYGRTESIEEEGKKFIEENVALNWKNQTLDAIREQLASHAAREQQLEQDLQHCEDQIQGLQQALERVTEKIELKKVAQAEQLIVSENVDRLTKKVDGFASQREELLNRQNELQASTRELAEEIARIEQLLQAESISPQTMEEMELLATQIEELGDSINYRQTLQQIEEMANSLASIQQEFARTQRAQEELQTFVQELGMITKIDPLMKHVHDRGIRLPVGVNEQVNELNRLIANIKSSQSADGYNEWQQLINRLLIAIEKVENLLRQNGFLKQSVQGRGNPHQTTIAEIHEVIDRVGRFLIAPSTKRVLDTRHYSADKYEYLEKIAVALEVLYARKNYAQVQLAKFSQYQQWMDQSKSIFAAIKTALIEQVNHSVSNSEQQITTMQQEIEQQQHKLNDFRQASAILLEKCGAMDETIPIHTMKEQQTQHKQVYAAYQETIANLEQYKVELDTCKKDAECTAAKLESQLMTLQELTQESEQACTELAEQQQRQKDLAEIVEQNPEAERQQLRETIYALSEQIELLQKDKSRLPITHALQQQWLSLLTEANDYDLDEIRKLYVRHANVIGTTCVASARRDFMEEYPAFDVVIIDEVSKATPPELLLPMLKGKKIILVGDHHQLPPLIGQETLEEFLEEIDSQADKKEFDKLLNESLFERLFRTLPKQNKTMLGIQYRMHESIMETITPFYAEGDYRLQCGLTDSDAMRDHLMESRYVQRNNHLLWFDMPNTPQYFEDKVKGGTSRFNPAELTMIRKLLADLESATQKAKNEGKMGATEQKSVGVISFYGEQVKRIDRLIQQELMPRHLHCRTGSVDKFQGMEMDIIILSFVRNHGEKGGDIGFAKDYRRLNVALSRARELLIIVGSSEMFTMRTKHPRTRGMYNRLLENVKMNNGLRDHEGMLKS